MYATWSFAFASCALYASFFASSMDRTVAPYTCVAFATGMVAEYARDALLDARDSSLYVVIASMCVLTGWLSLQDARFAVGTVKALALAWFYAIPVPGTGVCIKTLFPLSKILFVSFMHAWWFCTVARESVPAYVTASIFVFCFGNTAALDIKDIADDRKRSVVTLATLLGSAGTRTTLVILCATSAAVFGRYRARLGALFAVMAAIHSREWPNRVHLSVASNLAQLMVLCCVD